MFESFAYPGAGDFVSLAEHLCRVNFERMRGRLDMFAAKHGLPSIAAPMSPLEHPLALWCGEMGVIRMALLDGFDDADWDRLRLQFDLLAFSVGAAESLAVDGTVSKPLTFGGLLTPVGKLQLHGDREGLIIRSLDSGETQRFEQVRTNGFSPRWTHANAPAPLKLGSAAVASFSPAQWMGVWQSEDDVGQPISPETDRFRSQVESAFELLERHALTYYVWCSALMPEVSPLPALGAGTSSRSFVLWPGQIHMSLASPLQTVTMLAHECSHQYFHLLMWALPLVHEGAPDVFSVLKGRHRPLYRVLLGYHAFANVQIVLNALKGADGVDDAALAREAGQARRLVNALADGLLDTGLHHLTQAGRDLFDPLEERLAQLGLSERQVFVE